MNIKIAAALLLSPLMVHAQAHQLAQPQAATAPVLESSLVRPAGLMLASKAARVPAATPAADRVSTGVVEPKLIRTAPIMEDTVSVPVLAKGDREAVVHMIVDESGKPTDVKIVESAGASLDHNIVEAVEQFRYKPATVSGEVSAAPVTLHLLIH